MIRFLSIAAVLLAVCILAAPVLDPLFAGGAVGVYQLLGGDAAYVHPESPRVATMMINGHFPEERLGIRDASW